MLTHTNENFQTYPTHRVVAMIDTKHDADEAVAELIKAGFDDSLIDESVGTDGLKFLDPDGRSHGFMTKFIRLWQRAAQGEELGYINRVRKNLVEGHAVVSVPATTEEARTKAASILNSHHADDIRYYGHFYVERLQTAIH